MKTEPKWTPGPWTIESNSDGSPMWSFNDYNDDELEIVDSAHNTVGTAIDASRKRDPRTLATARLWCSAPDLYAALEAINAYAAQHCMDLPPGLAGLCLNGERALAKARGEAATTPNKP